jgi:hypothetical protein
MDDSGRTVASPIDGSAIIAFPIAAAKRAYIATADGGFEKSDFANGSDETTWVARPLPNRTTDGTAVRDLALGQVMSNS